MRRQSQNSQKKPTAQEKAYIQLQSEFLKRFSQIGKKIESIQGIASQDLNTHQAISNVVHEISQLREQLEAQKQNLGSLMYLDLANYLATLYYHTGQYDLAIHYAKLVSAEQNKQSKKRVTNATGILADSHKVLGSYAESIESYLKLLELEECAKKRADYYLILCELYLQEEINDLQKAQQNVAAAFKLLANEKEDTVSKRECYFYLGKCYLKAKNYLLAHQALKKSLSPSILKNGNLYILLIISILKLKETQKVKPELDLELKEYIKHIKDNMPHVPSLSYVLIERLFDFGLDNDAALIQNLNTVLDTTISAPKTIAKVKVEEKEEKSTSSAEIFKKLDLDTTQTPYSTDKPDSPVFNSTPAVALPILSIGNKPDNQTDADAARAVFGK